MVRNTTSLLALVRRNVGVTLLPYLSISEDDPSLVRLPIAGERLSRLVGVHRRHGESLAPTAAVFVAMLSHHVASLAVGSKHIDLPE